MGDFTTFFSKQENHFLWFDAFCFEGSIGWAFSNSVNALFEINLNDFSTKYLASVPDEPCEKEGMYWSITKVEKKLVLIPATSGRIAIYNLDSGQIDTIKFKLGKCPFCIGFAKYENTIFMSGYRIPMIVAFDISDYSIEYYDLNLEAGINAKEDVVFRKNYTVKDDCYYLVTYNSNLIVKFDMKKRIYQLFRIDVDYSDVSLNNLCYQGGSFWISLRGVGGVIEWNEEKGVIGIYYLPKEFEESYSATEIIAIGDDIWMFPCHGNDIWIFSTIEHKWRREDLLIRFGARNNIIMHPWGQTVPMVSHDDDIIYFFSGIHNSLVRYEIGRQELFEKRMDISGVLKDIYFKYHEKRLFIHEQDTLLLEDFLQLYL